jgi:hypothetical protein
MAQWLAPVAAEGKLLVRFIAFDDERPGASHEWIDAKCDSRSNTLKKVRGEPPPEIELELQSQEYELGEYTMIVLTWEDASRGAPRVFIEKCEEALTEYENRSADFLKRRVPKTEALPDGGKWGRRFSGMVWGHGDPGDSERSRNGNGARSSPCTDTD